jgi:hypothetical protein
MRSRGRRLVSYAVMLPAWDRLLETCLKQNAAIALLVSGSPPLLLIKGAWRTLDVPPLESAHIATLAEQQLGDTRPGADGFAHCEFAYGDIARFSVIAFGYPSTTALVVTRGNSIQLR